MFGGNVHTDVDARRPIGIANACNQSPVTLNADALAIIKRASDANCDPCRQFWLTVKDETPHFQSIPPGS